MTDHFTGSCTGITLTGGTDTKLQAEILRFYAESVARSPRAFAHHPSEVSQDNLSRLADGLFKPGSLWAIHRNADGIVDGIARLKTNTGAKTRHKAEIGSMAVRSGHRRAGIASALLDTLEANAPAHVDFIRLYVNADLDGAIALYSSKGFEIYATEPAAMRDEAGEIDEHVMQKRLTRA